MTLFLIGYLDTAKNPPTMDSAGLSFEKPEHITSDKLPVELGEITAETLVQVFELVRTSPNYEWLRPLLFV